MIMISDNNIGNRNHNDDDDDNDDDNNDNNEENTENTKKWVRAFHSHYYSKINIYTFFQSTTLSLLFTFHIPGTHTHEIY